jgi:hypothetical protein
LKLLHKFVTEPAAEAEAKLYEKFNNHRLSGEWFKLSPDHISFLISIMKYQDGEFIKKPQEPEPKLKQ